MCFSFIPFSAKRAGSCNIAGEFLLHWYAYASQIQWRTTEIVTIDNGTNLKSLKTVSSNQFSSFVPITIWHLQNFPCKYNYFNKSFSCKSNTQTRIKNSSQHIRPINDVTSSMYVHTTLPQSIQCDGRW